MHIFLSGRSIRVFATNAQIMTYLLTHIAYSLTD